MNETILNTVKEIIKDSTNIVFFGGAGVSTASNIPDFRGSGGLYKGKSVIPVESILSHDFFYNHPKDFYDFYFNKLVYKDALPNNCHKVLNKLEKLGKLTAVITQNIDNLHQKAGSINVYELHGTIYKNHCTKCHKFYSLDELLERKIHPYCDCGGIIKPDVVLYGESLNMDILYKSIDLILKSDVLIVGGTSLTVYPASGLINYYHGKKLILINKDKTPYDDNANYVINDDIDYVFKEIGKIL